MQYVYFGVGLRVVGNLLSHEPASLRVRIAQMGVKRYAVEKLSASARFRKQLRLFGRKSEVSAFPAVRFYAYARRSPAVPHGVIHHIAQLYFGYYAAHEFRTFLLRELFAALRVPAVEKLERRSELNEIAVKARLGSPVHNAEHVFYGYRALDCNASVPSRRNYVGANRKFAERFSRYSLARRAGAQKPATRPAQKIVHAEQKRARTRSGYTAPPAFYVNYVAFFEKVFSVVAKKRNIARFARNHLNVFVKFAFAKFACGHESSE